MYFPYLFGKQRELIAIREAIERLESADHVRPVIEPVRRDSASLLRTIELCEEAGQPLYVGINPYQSDFQGMSFSEAYDWGRELFDFSGSEYIRPTLLISASTTPADVRRFGREFSGQEVGLSLRSSSLAVSVIAESISHQDSRIFFHGPEPSAVSVEHLDKGRCVWVEDRFPLQERNADYGGRSFFTDRHRTWRTTGYAGFSDYTVLGPTVRDGGGPPGAVAFHMTHIELADRSTDVYVEHFVSDRQDQTERDNDGKFMEALSKFSRSVRRTSSSFGLTAAASEYLERYETNRPPSLAASKSLQICHHMELVHGLLVGDFPAR